MNTPTATTNPQDSKNVKDAKATKAAKVLEITGDNFEHTVMSSPVPVLVDFWAAWCAPCRTMAPHVEALATAYDGQVRVGKCDADGFPELTAQLDVRSLPTFLMFKQGRVVGQIVGGVPRGRLEDLVKKSLA